MSKFQDIIGQEQIVEHLQTAVMTGKVSHAYMICGERGSGKEFIANVFAMTLQCEKGGKEPCGICHSCKQAMTGNHPDIITLTHEKPNSIGVEDIRQKISGDMLIKPYQGARKIYIMNEGDKMTIQAQNALLKTLEEPPSYGVILILTANKESLLPTIQSRCVTLQLKPVSDEVMRKFLMEDLKIPSYKAEVCVAFARGNIGRARALAKSEEFDHLKQEAIVLMRHIKDMEIHEIIGAIKNITEYKMDVSDYLDLLSVWYRDVLLFKATNDANHLIFKEEIQYIRKVADQSAYEGIELIIHSLDKAKSRLKANVSFELTMELLLLTIKEN